MTSTDLIGGGGIGGVGVDEVQRDEGETQPVLPAAGATTGEGEVNTERGRFGKHWSVLVTCICSIAL